MFRSRMALLLAQNEHTERRKITQTELAQKTNLSRATIGRWLDREYVMPRLDAGTVAVLCDYFGCEMQDLVDLEDFPEGVAVLVA